MKFPKIMRIGAAVTLGAALTLFAVPIAASSAAASPASVTSSAGAVHRTAPTMIPQEKATWIFTGYSYADTSPGRSACESKGKQLVSEGVGFNYSCEYGNPDSGRWNVWVESYI